MFWFLKRKKEYGTGLIKDPRPETEKAKDYAVEELFAEFPVEWKEKPEADWRKFPIFNQDQSSSCVAQATAKILGIENYLEEGKFIHYSARDIYSRRSNKPGLGMWLQDGLSIGSKFGATIEQLMPSQNQAEVMMNDDLDRTPLTDQIAYLARGGNYVFVSDIDKIAFVIAQGRGVEIGVRFSMAEWNREVPIVIDNSNPYGHMIASVDYFLYQQKKCLLIEDSWGEGVGIKGRRIITEDFLKAKCVGGGYFTTLPNKLPDAVVEKPKYRFTQQMALGSRSYEVAMLQRCLGYEKDELGWLFPLETIPTGYYGGITRQAVERFQKKYQLVITGNVNAVTLVKLNEIFA